MNRKELARRVASVMREQNIRKPITLPRQVFHISDDNGNSKDFIIRKTDETVSFTLDDVEAMLDACTFVIEEAIKHGEQVSVRGFGTLGLRYRKPRATKRPGTDEWVDIEARYVPKFMFGNDLRMCAKLYELSLRDNNAATDRTTEVGEDDDAD